MRGVGRAAQSSHSQVMLAISFLRGEIRAPTGSASRASMTPRGVGGLSEAQRHYHTFGYESSSCFEGSLEILLGGRNPGQPDLLYSECLNVAAANSRVTNAKRLRKENAYYCIADCRWHEGARTGMRPSCGIAIPPPSCVGLSTPVAASAQSPPPRQALVKPMCGKDSWRVANMHINNELAKVPENCKTILRMILEECLLTYRVDIIAGDLNQGSSLVKVCFEDVVKKHSLPISKLHFACSDGALCCLIIEWQKDDGDPGQQQYQVKFSCRQKILCRDLGLRPGDADSHAPLLFHIRDYSRKSLRSHSDLGHEQRRDKKKKRNKTNLDLIPLPPPLKPGLQP